tara:strand:+ start:707 stop:1549 length:843 start_codon:yes stop_codon:yes gene_type:complete
MDVSNNKKFQSIDAYKYQNLVCDYCNKKYTRYGSYMKHIESCQYKFRYNNINNTCYNDNNKSNDDKMMYQNLIDEISYLRREVAEMHEIIFSYFSKKNESNDEECLSKIPPKTKPKITIINNRDKNTLQNKDNKIEFHLFINQLEFCNESQLMDIFDSDDIVDSFFYLWNEAFSKYKESRCFIPLKTENYQLFKFENSQWCIITSEQLSRIIDYLFQKILQQLSLYQAKTYIKNRIEKETTFRDYYLKQVTKVQSEKVIKYCKTNPQVAIEKLGFHIQVT